MRPSLPLLIPDPALVQVPVQLLLAHFATALPWLSHRYGLVQTGQRVVDKRTERFPQRYRQDGTTAHDDLRPDASMDALCFFERNGVSEFVWDDGAEGISGSWQHPLALVVWLNLPLIEPGLGYDFSDRLLRDTVRALLLSGVETTVPTAEQRPEEVFRRYDWPVSKHQLLMYPYAAFRLAFTVSHADVPAGCL